MQGVGITWQTKKVLRKKQMDVLMEKYDINENAASIMLFLRADRENGFTNGEVADGTGLNPHAVTGIVNSLVKKGLVLRTKDKHIILVEQKED